MFIRPYKASKDNTYLDKTITLKLDYKKLLNAVHTAINI